jgi:hypothetical protein
LFTNLLNIGLGRVGTGLREAVPVIHDLLLNHEKIERAVEDIPSWTSFELGALHQMPNSERSLAQSKHGKSLP